MILRMSCDQCRPRPGSLTRSPFKLTEGLVRAGHDGCDLAICRHCERPALHFWVDVFDDYWTYWCPIDEAERAQLIGLRGDERAIDLARSFIVTREVVENHPTGVVRWWPGNAATLDGPPW
jgi:hypothetical protein